MRYIHDAYMDGGDYVAIRYTVIDSDGYWLLDTCNKDTAEHEAIRSGGYVKIYDGKDKYRGT